MKSVNKLWSPVPKDLELLDNEVHIWLANLDQLAISIHELLAILSADEIERANRFYFARDRQRFIVSRGYLRIILGHYLAIEPSQVKFVYGKYGKPELAIANPQKTLYFNLSHSQGLALYAIAQGRQLGIDLEYLRDLPDAEKLAERFFSAQEYTLINKLPVNEKQKTFFRYWTCKEAYLKAIGDGLRTALDDVEISLSPSESASLFSVKGDRNIGSKWFLEEFVPEIDYVGAIAIEGQSCKISYWLFTQ